MKNVKADIRLIKNLAIYRWIEPEGYFSGSIDRDNSGLSSSKTNTAWVQMISPPIQEFITLEQIADMLKFFKLNYLYASKVTAITDSGHFRFCSAISHDYNQTPILFVENKFHYYNDFCRNAFKISTNYGKNNLGTY